MIETIKAESRLDVHAVRKHFPVLERLVKGRPLVYFDNAATTQKPEVVIDALVNYYKDYNANIHRGIHTLAEEATAAFESTRDAVKEFINAGSREQVIFTSGTTEGINLVAQTWGSQNIPAFISRSTIDKPRQAKATGQLGNIMWCKTLCFAQLLNTHTFLITAGSDPNQ